MMILSGATISAARVYTGTVLDKSELWEVADDTTAAVDAAMVAVEGTGE